MMTYLSVQVKRQCLGVRPGDDRLGVSTSRRRWWRLIELLHPRPSD